LMKKKVVDLEVMFIRFVGAEIDERSHVAAACFVLRRNYDGLRACLIRGAHRIEGLVQCSYALTLRLFATRSAL